MTQVETGSVGGSAAVARPAKQIPGWVAGVAAVVFLVGVGAFIYWFMGGSFTGTSGLIPDPARAERPERGPRGFRQANADGVQALPDGRYMVKSGSAIMDVIAAGDKRPVRHEFRYDSQALLTPEQWHLALGLRQLSNEQWVKTLDISKDQMDRLRRLTAVPMELATADREKVIAAWTAYQKATAKGEPEKVLLAALKAGGDKALVATKVRAQQRVTEIAKVLTAEQVRELTKLGAGQKVTPIAPRAAGATTKKS